MTRQNREMLAFFVLLLGGLAVVSSVQIVQAVTLAWSDVDNQGRIAAALIAGAGTLLTGLGAFGLWSVQHRSDLRKEHSSRERRVFRRLVALRAELALNLISQYRQFGPDNGRALRAQTHEMLETSGMREHSMPLSVVRKKNDIYDTFQDDLMELPASVLSNVIRYYQLDEYVSELLMSFSSGQFEKVRKKRRKKAIDNLYDLGAEAVTAALAAFDSVDRAVIVRADQMLDIDVADCALEPATLSQIAEITRDLESAKAHRPDETGPSDDNDGGQISHE